MLHEDEEYLVCDLCRIKAIRFGEFRLKSGILSPFYIDLRRLISYPMVLQAVAVRLLAVLEGLTFRRMAGIPYAGLPIATAISLASKIPGIPMIYARKEAKGHGTDRIIEGEFNPGETVVLVDDVISDGASKCESAQPMTDAGLVVRDVVVLLDRETGGAEILKQKGFTLHSALRITDVLAYLESIGQLEADTHTLCRDFITKIRQEAMQKSQELTGKK